MTQEEIVLHATSRAKKGGGKKASRCHKTHDGVESSIAMQSELKPILPYKRHSYVWYVPICQIKPSQRRQLSPNYY